MKSRHEFVVSGEQQGKGIETFLPSISKLSQWKDRKKCLNVPLFPGYLFVSQLPDPDEFLRFLKTRGAVTFISLEPGHPTPVASEEIRALKILLAVGKNIDVNPHLKQGARVRVKNGYSRALRESWRGKKIMTFCSSALSFWEEALA